MCNLTGIAFGEATLTPDLVAGRTVLEVGALDVNGSLHPHVDPWARPATSASTSRPGRASTRWSTRATSSTTSAPVRSTWSLRPRCSSTSATGGWSSTTSRASSPPAATWSSPPDRSASRTTGSRTTSGATNRRTCRPSSRTSRSSRWSGISAAPGVFMLARKPEPFSEAATDVRLFSIVSGRRQSTVSTPDLLLLRLAGPPSPEGRPRVVRARGALRRTATAFRRRVVSPIWLRLPASTRSTVKHALGRGDRNAPRSRPG